MASSKLPQTMRQLLQPSLHSTNLTLTTAPVPTPSSPSDVLVGVSTCSPCKDELIWALNPSSPAASGKVPIPCLDFAGIVVLPAGSSLPQGTTPLQPGDRVFGCISPSRSGAAREYAIVDEAELARIPDTLGWIDAAATPLSALTAWQGLFVHGGLDKGGLKGTGSNEVVRVLVTGASGGVGSWAVQFAKVAGARVVGVCGGGGKGNVVRALGADEVVDYTRTSIEEWVGEDPGRRQVDLVLDTAGGGSLEACWTAVKEGGSIVSICAPPETARPETLRKRLGKSLFFILETTGSDLAEIAELLEAGRVRPLVDTVWELDKFEDAFERVNSGKAMGKVVIRVRGDI